jgi:histidyl-tRNA synthetase
MLRAFGLTADDVVARVSDRRILHAYLRALGIDERAFATVFAVIDKIDRQPRVVSAKKLSAMLTTPQTEAILGISATTLAHVRAQVTNPDDVRYLDDLDRYLRYVNALVPNGERWVRVDLSIVRGLAYYTGIVFELFDRTGEFRAICGGGRYDTLLQSLGDAELPALGFGMGDVVLTELLRSKGLLRSEVMAPDVWVAARDETVALEQIMQEAARLRADGKSVEYALRPQSYSKQVKAARTLGAHDIVVYPEIDG